MPLGDSITVGKGSGGTNVSVTDYMTGYRQQLYRQLAAAGYAIDFVGGEQAGRLATPGFDLDHEAHSGYSASEIAYARRTTGQGRITNWLAADPADVILLHVGNEYTQEPSACEQICAASRDDPGQDRWEQHR